MENKISLLESRIVLYLRFAWAFVIMAIVPLFYAGYVVFYENGFWKEEDLGSFIGGVSGTFAALAGVFFVYIAFLGQRISILQQQIEIQDNRKELQETREEIKGQKEQLELQNKFNLDSKRLNKFFKLLDSYILVKSRILYKNYILNEIQLSEYYGSAKGRQDLEGQFVPKIEYCYEEEAFKNIIFHLQNWAKTNWKTIPPNNFLELNNYQYIPKRLDFSWETATIPEISFLIKAISNEESLGAYFRLLQVFVNYIIDSELIEELNLIEAQMGKNERIFAFYYTYSQNPFKNMDQLKESGFLHSVSPKHLITPSHYHLLLK